MCEQSLVLTRHAQELILDSMSANILYFYKNWKLIVFFCFKNYSNIISNNENGNPLPDEEFQYFLVIKNISNNPMQLKWFDACIHLLSIVIVLPLKGMFQSVWEDRFLCYMNTLQVTWQLLVKVLSITW